MKAEQDATKASGGGGTEKDVIETRTERVRLGEDGILRAISKPGAEMTLADARENIATATKITGGRKVPLLLVVGVRSISREARNHLAGEAAADLFLAQAIVVGSPLSRVIGNFFLGFSKPSFPTRLFTSEDQALEWLRGFMK